MSDAVRYLTAVLTIGCAGGALAELPTAALEQAEAVRERALQGTGAYEIVESLTMEVGPRLAGSEGDRAAVAWALTTLNDMQFDSVRTENVEVPHWVRGAIDARITGPFPQTLRAAALGGSIGTSEEGLEAPVVAVVDLDDLKSRQRSEIQDKIVYFSKRTEPTRDGSGYAETVLARVYGAIEAARLGAAGVAIRSAGTSRGRFPHTGMMRYEQDVRQIPAIALANPDADMLEYQLATGELVSLRIRLTSRQLPARRSANVVAELAGSDPQSGIVLLAAHLDSWDLGPGAIDDGAGVAIVVEAARLIRALQLRPRRTIRVVLFANEEFGLSGARAYAASHAEELHRHVIGLEADFGAGLVWRLRSRVPDAALPLVCALHAGLAPLGIERGDNLARGGPDLRPLRERGMPVLELTQDGSDYFDYHHTADDTLDKIERADLDQCVAAFAVTAFLAASGSDDFGRLPEVVESQ